MNRITKDIYKDFTPLPLSLSGWNSDSPVFAELIKQYKPEHIIEVGTWLGGSAITMAQACADAGIRGSCRISCVDTWLGALEFWGELANTPERDLKLKNGYPQVYYQFLSNVVHKGFQDMILPFPTTSAIAARFFKKYGMTADLVYIDGSHDYDDVMADLKAYWGIATSVLFGDDYEAWRDNVGRAVDDFCKVNNLRFEVKKGMWIIRK